MFAMWGLALVPTLSHALSFAQGGRSALAEVCTPQGTQLVAVDDAAVDGRVPSTGAHHLEHCPYCAAGALTLGLPSTPVATPLHAPAGATAPPPLRRAPWLTAVWVAAQPRAPPTLR